MVRITKKINKLIKIFFTFDLKLINGLFNGVAAGIEHKKLFNNLNNLNTIIDIGSNKGQFALISRYFYKKAKIYSFDPLPDVKKTYTKVLKNNCLFFNCAIGPQKKRTFLNISKKNDSSSILEITKNQNKIFKNTECVGKLSIKMKKLSDCLDLKDLKLNCLLKIDVQGFELDTLKGCQLFLKKIKYIYIECSSIEFYKNQSLFKEVKKFLYLKDFKIKKKFNPEFYNNKLVQADYLFENSKLN